MNKENWITAALDGSASEENIKFFLDLSFELTAPKIKKYQKNCNP
jgi:predicted DNA-binding protein (MmcQ/YjbR family)